MLDAYKRPTYERWAKQKKRKETDHALIYGTSPLVFTHLSHYVSTFQLFKNVSQYMCIDSEFCEAVSYDTNITEF